MTQFSVFVTKCDIFECRVSYIIERIPGRAYMSFINWGKLSVWVFFVFVLFLLYICGDWEVVVMPMNKLDRSPQSYFTFHLIFSYFEKDKYTVPVANIRPSGRKMTTRTECFTLLLTL